MKLHYIFHFRVLWGSWFKHSHTGTGVRVEKKLDSIIHSTDIDNLDIIYNGAIPPNPSELLDSKVMKEFIELSREKYDIILFDSPPLIAVTDAYILLNSVDQFILVVRAGVTERASLNRVLTMIEQSKIKITGAVLNAISEKHSYGAGYYYNYYQYYYGDESTK